MLHVCFTPSERTVIRLGLGVDPVAIFEALDQGKIDTESFFEERYKRFLELSAYIPSAEREEEAKMMYVNEAKNLRDVIDRTQSGEKICIWNAQSASSKCAFYCLVYFLQSAPCDILSVELSGNPVSGSFVDSSWSMVDPDDVAKLSKRVRLLSTEERSEIVCKWKKLISENADLRILSGGDVLSVSQDYFDSEILKYAPIEQEKMPNYIGEVMRWCKHPLSPLFIRERIFHLIEKGDLVLLDCPEDDTRDDLYVLRRRR